jgi:hypothetical protein
MGDLYGVRIEFNPVRALAVIDLAVLSYGATLNA